MIFDRNFSDLEMHSHKVTEYVKNHFLDGLLRLSPITYRYNVLGAPGVIVAK